MYDLIAVGIHYNDKGNPVVLNYSLDAYTQDLPKFSVIYRYDSKDRLIEVDPEVVDPVYMENESVTTVLPHRFVYEGDALLPIRDSILSDTAFRVSEGTPYKLYTVKVEDLYYDDQGRLNRVVSRRQFVNTLYAQEENTSYEIQYSYDANGNRQIVNDQYAVVSYTDKPSLYSLHPVWQLIHQNWSRNAAVANVQNYNNNGLPTKSDMRGSRFLQTKNTNNENPFFNITYTCL
jgi:hypothetical protein